MKRRFLMAILGLSFAVSAPAQARVSSDLTYRYSQLWTASVRLIRVDYGFAIIDQDRDVGFVLFKYRDRQREVDGSVELVRTEIEGRSYIRVSITIPQMPRYIEQMIMDRFTRKLTEDFGAPPEARRPAPPPEDDGEGDEGDDEEDDDEDEEDREDDDESADRSRRG